jgi:hypothetical protein
MVKEKTFKHQTAAIEPMRRGTIPAAPLYCPTTVKLIPLPPTVPVTPALYAAASSGVILCCRGPNFPATRGFRFRGQRDARSSRGVGGDLEARFESLRIRFG